MRVMEALTKLVVGMGRLGDHLLSRKASGIIVAALAFACGASLAYALGREPRTKPVVTPPLVTPVVTPVAAAPPCETAAPPTPAATDATDYYREMMGTPELEVWRNRHNGEPLPIDFDLRWDWGTLYESKVVALPSGRTLVAKGVTLFMFDARRRVEWKRELSRLVIDFAYIGATGMVYVTAGDNNMLILDAATGKVLLSESRQGSAGFGVVLPYGEDACLVADEMSGYRAGYSGVEASRPPMQDGVTAWRGTRMLWHRDVPPGAELQVAGSKIYAVTKTRTRILVKEIKAPNGRR